VIASAITRSFDWSGLSTRKEAWTVFGAVCLVLAASVFTELWLTELSPQSPRWTFLLAAALVLPTSAVIARRLNAMGRSQAWMLVLWGASSLLLAYVLIFTGRGARNTTAPTVIGTVTGLISVVLLVMVMASRAFWAPYWIPSGATKPSLLIGDYLLARYIEPSAAVRGDVLVFRHPVNDNDMIKRLIGLPGDTVQVRDNILFINGAEAPQVADGMFEELFEKQGPMGQYPRCENGPVGEGGNCTSSRYRETLPNGAVHAVLNIQDDGDADNTDIYTVPAGHYFFMGDNRDNSTDSRFPQTVGGVGFVPAENLIGRADRVMFSSAGRSLLYVWTWRADRFFKAVE
jgi:signal peptidase I